MSCKNNYEIAVGIFRGYFSPIIFIFGFFGNIFVIWTFTAKPLRNRFAIYSVFLALSNIIILITGTLIDDFSGRGLAYAVYKGCSKYVIKFDTISDFYCKLFQYLPESMYFISSWIFVVFSIDRLLTIYNPMKFYSNLHSLKSLFLCLSVVVLSFSINSSILISSGLRITVKSNKTYRKCDVLTDTAYLSSVISLYTKIIFSFIIPIFFVIIINSIILLKLFQVNKNRKKLFSKNNRKNGMEINRIVGYLMLSSCFLLLVFPLIIVMIIRLYWTNRSTGNQSEVQYVKMLADLSRLFSSLKDINYAADFYIYVLFLYNFKWCFYGKVINLLSILKLRKVHQWQLYIDSQITGVTTKVSNSSSKATKSGESKF